MDFEEIINAIQWRICSLKGAGDVERDWKEIETWLRAEPKRLDAVASRMAQPLIEIIRWGLIPGIDGNTDASRWIALRNYLQDHEEIPSEMALAVASFISDHFNEAKSGESDEQAIPALNDRKADGAGDLEIVSGTAQIDEQTEVLPAVMDTDDQAEIASPSGPNPQEDETTLTPEEESRDAAESAPDSNPPSVTTQWRYLPVPDDPDKHDEFDKRAGFSPEGLKIIGARVRGKKHKHEGTNCDDWFEFGSSGAWTIIAVSDGAGSKVFSRIGAKESCETAMKTLSDSLAEHTLKKRDNWSNDTFKRDEQTGVFTEEDLEYVQQELHSAMARAYAAVEAKAQELADSAAHEALLGRKVVMDDLSGTLLLAVHTSVIHEDNERSFVLACQIGDGMLAALSSNGGLKLMGVPDSGEFAGQTEFLTSKKKMAKANLTGKTFPFFGPMQALMVMTDGVADDYFPNDPGMLRLYGDLAINGILHLRGDRKNERKLIDSSLAKTDLENTEGVANAGLASAVEAVTADGPRQVFIRSVEIYADKLGLPLADVVKSTPLLMAGTISNPGEELCAEKESEEMLRVWLDSYHVRGSFDDRTLVVLYREMAA